MYKTFKRTIVKIEMNKSDLIDKYIQNRTTAEELEIVKKLMVEDQNFKEEIVFQLELRKAVQREESQALKFRLQSFEKRQNSQKSYYRTLSSIAAIFVIGLGLLWFLNMTPDHKKIYAENFKPYPNIVVPIVRDINSQEDNIREAFRYYEDREYAKATIAFRDLFLEDKIEYANFYYGISLMADNQFEKAVEVLSDPNWKIPEKYQNQTNWYLALGYLRIDKIEKSREYLEKVIQANGSMAKQAKHILEKIK